MKPLYMRTTPQRFAVGFFCRVDMLVLLVLLISYGIVHGRCARVWDEGGAVTYIVFSVPAIPTLMFGEAWLAPRTRFAYWVRDRAEMSVNYAIAVMGLIAWALTIICIPRVTTRSADRLLLLVLCSYLTVVVSVLVMCIVYAHAVQGDLLLSCVQ